MISYLVTTHDEDISLKKLLSILEEQLKKNKQDEVVILDDYSSSENTKQILEIAKNCERMKVVYHSLNKNYSEHKNFGNKECKNDYIFAIDADEYPHEVLLNNLHDIVSSNISVDLYHFPRFNIVHGLTEKFLKIFQWNVSVTNALIGNTILNKNSEEYIFLKSNNCILTENIKDDNVHIQYKIPCINLPDYQGRLYKNKKEIYWTRKLHEHITGYKIETKFPISIEYSLIHEKTIQKQWKQNEFYNTNFSVEDNIRIM
jgi:hypothetical protein